MIEKPENKKFQSEDEELAKFVTTLVQQTHAGVTLVLSTTLERMLVTILEGNMPHLTQPLKSKLFSGYGPLASFSSKIDLAYSLGLITAYEHRSLHAIRVIRNAFAHSDDLELNFDHNSLVHTLAKLPDPREKDQTKFQHFTSTVFKCQKSLQKHIETINLVSALKNLSASKPFNKNSPK